MASRYIKEQQKVQVDLVLLWRVLQANLIKIGVVSSGVYDAEAVACVGKAEVKLFDYGCGGIGKVDSNKAAACTCGLVHKSARLTEEYVLCVLRDLCKLGGVYLALVVEVVHYVTDLNLESGGGRDSRALKHV